MRTLHRPAIVLAISLIVAALIFTAIDTKTFAGNFHAARATVISLNLLPAPSPQPNSPPVAADDSYTIHYRMAPLNPGALSNDFDPDGDLIRICSVPVRPQHGSLTHNGQNFSFTAHAGYVGPDSFTYRICDDHFNSSQPATVNINIVNTPPVAVDDFHVVLGRTDLGSLLANDFDPDGDPIEGIVYFIEPAYPFPAHGNIQRYESVPGSSNYDSVIFRASSAESSRHSDAD